MVLQKQQLEGKEGAIPATFYKHQWGSIKGFPFSTKTPALCEWGRELVGLVLVGWSSSPMAENGAGDRMGIPAAGVPMDLLL